MREIKFKCWNKLKNKWLHDIIINQHGTVFEFVYGEEPGDGDYKETNNVIIMQFIGLKDKNGREIYEGDLLRIRVFMGENKEYFSDGIYRVNKLSYTGVSLSFVKIMDNDPKNQYPICQTPSFEYHSLTNHHRNNLFDHIALADTWGENTLSRHKWQENHYSNDIEKIGNIYENPELIK